MSFVDNQPLSRNPLQPQSFRMVIQKFPITNYFTQSVSFPGVTVPEVVQTTTFADIPWPGTKIRYDDLIVEFIVDENLQNYNEIYSWLRMYSRAVEPVDQEISEFDLFSDIELLSTTNSLVVNKRIVFRNAVPISLSGFRFDSADSDVATIKASVSFKYSHYCLLDLTVDPCNQ